MSILDIRPHCEASCSCEDRNYALLRRGELTAQAAEKLLPERSTLGMVWRYLAACEGPIKEAPICLCRKIVRWSGVALSLEQLLTCLDIFRDVGLLRLDPMHKYLHITLTQSGGKADLRESVTMQRLLRAKES